MHPYDNPFIGIDGSFPLWPAFLSVWESLGMVHIMVNDRSMSSFGGSIGKAPGTYSMILTQVPTHKLLGMLLEVFRSKVLIPTLREC